MPLTDLRKDAHAAANKPAHTPGPWTAQPEDRNTYEDCIRITAGEAVVCAAWPMGEDNDPHQQPETVANSRLIAAAPDYFDASAAIIAAMETNAAPVNLRHALGQVETVTIDAGLLRDLLDAHAKAVQS